MRPVVRALQRRVRPVRCSMMYFGFRLNEMPFQLGNEFTIY
jgi:hypothetical protein